jgi:putative spermidine/putrescine transport system permease protein
MSDRLRIALLLTPALALIGLLFGGAMVQIVVRSFNWMPVIGLTDPGLDAYRGVLTDPRFLRSLGLTLYIALTATALASILAIGVALILRHSFAGRRVIMFLVQLNLTVPHVVAALGVLYLFSQSGFFARMAWQIGLIARPGDFPALTHDPRAIGIILHYVWKEVPFIALILVARMQTLGPDFESVARSLGASRWQAFRYVLLPMILPGLLAAGVIVFAFTFGAYEVPLLLGASHPPALPLLAWQTYGDPDLAVRPQAMAMAVVITLVSGAMIGGALRLARGRQ